MSVIVCILRLSLGTGNDAAVRAQGGPQLTYVSASFVSVKSVGFLD